MRALLKTIVDEIREDLGQPISLMRLLEQHPDIVVPLTPVKPCIRMQSVVQWHELGTQGYGHWPRHTPGSLTGWRRQGRHDYRPFTLECPEYKQIGLHQTVEDWSCDISEIHGFSASKSDLDAFETTDAMVETNSKKMISELTHEKLAENLRHNEIRIIHSPGSDCFWRYSWDGRLWLSNSGGSHHLAAAKYIATRLGVPVTLRGALKICSLNGDAIETLRREFEIFVVSDKSEIAVRFHKAMERFRATWLSHSMPRPYDKTKAVLLPRSEGRSMQVALLLRRAGAVDLGAYLADLVAAVGHNLHGTQRSATNKQVAQLTEVEAPLVP